MPFRSAGWSPTDRIRVTKQKLAAYSTYLAEERERLERVPFPETVDAFGL